MTDVIDSKSTDENNKETIELLNELKLLAPAEPVIAKAQVEESKFKTNLERFHYICKDLPSPNVFIDFDFYFMISSCLNRKVWIGDEGEIFRLHPNLFIICVADPGIGKSLPASAAQQILSSLTETRLDKKTKQYFVVKLLNLGPDAITFEKLILRAHASSDVVKDINGKHYHHSSTAFCIADEMGLLFHDNTKRVVYFLTKAWDCRDYEGDTIKHGEVLIKNICVNFLGCATPNMMHNLVKTGILDDGFTARVLFIYDNKKRQTVTKIQTTSAQTLEVKIIQKHLRKLATMPPTEMRYTDESYAWLDNWTKTRLDIIHNEHPRLKDYYGRKQAHLIKLAMNVHFAESLEPVMHVRDFEVAEKLLLNIETNMHKAVSGYGDNPNYNIAEDIKNYLLAYGVTSRQALKLKFYDRADMDKLDNIMEFLIQTEQCEATIIRKTKKAALKLVDTKKE